MFDYVHIEYISSLCGLITIALKDNTNSGHRLHILFIHLIFQNYFHNKFFTLRSSKNCHNKNKKGLENLYTNKKHTHKKEEKIKTEMRKLNVLLVMS